VYILELITHHPTHQINHNKSLEVYFW